MQELTEFPVISSGHAFICFDSLTAASKCLNGFEENTWDSFVLKLKNIWKGVKQKRIFEKKPSSTFGKFKDEDDIEMQMVNIEKVNILVDQMIEPFDIVWGNVGGDRGLNIFRRLLCNILIFCVLVFLTTPMVSLICLLVVDLLDVTITRSFESFGIQMAKVYSLWACLPCIYGAFYHTLSKHPLNFPYRHAM